MDYHFWTTNGKRIEIMKYQEKDVIKEMALFGGYCDWNDCFHCRTEPITWGRKRDYIHPETTIISPDKILKKKNGTILYVPNFLLTTHDKGEDHGPIFLNSRGARLTLWEERHHSIPHYIQMEFSNKNWDLLNQGTIFMWY